MKPFYVFVVSRNAGPCQLCRHANQGTVDFTEGHLFCGKLGEPRSRDDTCSVRIHAQKRAGQPVAEMTLYYLFERYNGSNRVEYGATGYNADVFPEDAEGERAEALQHALRALQART
jgi:hypothetical protein